MKHFKPTATLTVLVVDEDLGFVWWLGEILRNAGCTVLPALDCQQALDLVRDLRIRLDLVFVDPDLLDVSSMLEVLRKGEGKIKIVELPSPRDGAPNGG